MTTNYGKNINQYARDIQLIESAIDSLNQVDGHSLNSRVAQRLLNLALADAKCLIDSVHILSHPMP